MCRVVSCAGFFHAWGSERSIKSRSRDRMRHNNGDVKSHARIVMTRDGGGSSARENITKGGPFVLYLPAQQKSTK